MFSILQRVYYGNVDIGKGELQRLLTYAQSNATGEFPSKDIQRRANSVLLEHVTLFPALLLTWLKRLQEAQALHFEQPDNYSLHNLKTTIQLFEQVYREQVDLCNALLKLVDNIDKGYYEHDSLEQAFVDGFRDKKDFTTQEGKDWRAHLFSYLQIKDPSDEKAVLTDIRSWKPVLSNAVSFTLGQMKSIVQLLIVRLRDIEKLDSLSSRCTFSGMVKNLIQKSHLLIPEDKRFAQILADVKTQDPPPINRFYALHWENKGSSCTSEIKHAMANNKENFHLQDVRPPQLIINRKLLAQDCAGLGSISGALLFDYWFNSQVFWDRFEPEEVEASESQDAVLPFCFQADQTLSLSLNELQTFLLGTMKDRFESYLLWAYAADPIPFGGSYLMLDYTQMGLDSYVRDRKEVTVNNARAFLQGVRPLWMHPWVVDALAEGKDKAQWIRQPFLEYMPAIAGSDAKSLLQLTYILRQVVLLNSRFLTVNRHLLEEDKEEKKQVLVRDAKVLAHQELSFTNTTNIQWNQWVLRSPFSFWNLWNQTTPGGSPLFFKLIQLALQSVEPLLRLYRLTPIDILQLKSCAPYFYRPYLELLTMSLQALQRDLNNNDFAQFSKEETRIRIRNLQLNVYSEVTAFEHFLTTQFGMPNERELETKLLDPSGTKLIASTKLYGEIDHSVFNFVSGVDNFFSRANVYSRFQTVYFYRLPELLQKVGEAKFMPLKERDQALKTIAYSLLQEAQWPLKEPPTSVPVGDGVFCPDFPLTYMRTVLHGDIWNMLNFYDYADLTSEATINRSFAEVVQAYKNHLELIEILQRYLIYTVYFEPLEGVLLQLATKEAELRTGSLHEQRKLLIPFILECFNLPRFWPTVGKTNWAVYLDPFQIYESPVAWGGWIRRQWSKFDIIPLSFQFKDPERVGAILNRTISEVKDLFDVVAKRLVKYEFTEKKDEKAHLWRQQLSGEWSLPFLEAVERITKKAMLVHTDVKGHGFKWVAQINKVETVKPLDSLHVVVPDDPTVPRVAALVASREEDALIFALARRPKSHNSAGRSKRGGDGEDTDEDAVPVRRLSRLSVGEDGDEEDGDEEERDEQEDGDEAEDGDEEEEEEEEEVEEEEDGDEEEEESEEEYEEAAQESKELAKEKEEEKLPGDGRARHLQTAAHVHVELGNFIGLPDAAERDGLVRIVKIWKEAYPPAEIYVPALEK